MYSVGEGPGFDFSMLKGAEKLAAEDAARSERLAQQCKEIREATECECGAQIPWNSTYGQCPRCRKRDCMRKLRAEKREGLGHLPKPAPTVLCLACGTPTRKWVNRYEQHWCPECKLKPMEWRKKAAQARTMRATEAA